MKKIGRCKGGYVCRCQRRGCRLRNHRIWRAHKPLNYWGRNARLGLCMACKKPLTIDRYRNSGREAARNNCGCEGYPFQHRRGSLHCRFGVAGMAGFSFYDRGDDFDRWREAGQPSQWQHAA
ncbi:MAG TPA: hypothetical protein VFS13_00695 [Steroidobacteraceae bacterium]|nr:hypothetical protein [Steroidobacteraceae bacterium]